MAVRVDRVTDHKLTVLAQCVEDIQSEAHDADEQDQAAIFELQRRNDEALLNVAKWLDSIRLQMSTSDVVLEGHVDDDMKVTCSADEDTCCR
jgi:hypothetical protein